MANGRQISILGHKVLAMTVSSKMKVRAGNSVYEVEYAPNGDLIDVKIDGRHYRADVSSIYEQFYSILIDGRSVEALVSVKDNRFTVGFDGREIDVEFFDPRARKVGADMGKAVAEGEQPIKAPMAGRIVKILVKKDDEVQESEGLIVLEAMKMENKIVSQGMGKVLDILVSDDDTVESGQELMVIDMGKQAED
jgi:biotin carboxyl carrier protein